MDIPKSVPHPRLDLELFRIVSEEDYRDLSSRLRLSTPEDSVVSHICSLTIRSEQRWYKAAARPIWRAG